jgi:hypothetical protein
LKKQIAQIVLWFLGRGFQACAQLDSTVKAEVAQWRDDYSVLIKVEANGPCLVMKKKNNMLCYYGKSEIDADLSIYFKNIEAALLVLTGRIGIAQAFAEHRFVVKGDIMESMSLVRCLNIVEAYLFPNFILKNILKKIPKKETSSVHVYLRSILPITSKK